MRSWRLPRLRSTRTILALSGSVLVSAWALATEPATPPPPVPPVPPAAPVAPAPSDVASCPERPVAYVLEGYDPQGRPNRAGPLLQAAGFDVRPLPLDRSPFDLKGLIFLGSRASDRPEYARYMRQYAGKLHGFVDRGNVLVQMAQPRRSRPCPRSCPPPRSPAVRPRGWPRCTCWPRTARCWQVGEGQAGTGLAAGGRGRTCSARRAGSRSCWPGTPPPIARC